MSPAWRDYGAAVGLYLLLSLVVWANLWTHPQPTTICGCGDSATYLWFLQWQAHALAHGLNPFYSRALNYPTGVNLMLNPVGVVLAPVTWVFGAVASLNFLLIVSPVASAVAMYALLRRWVRWRPAVLVGGLFYGFSPFVIQGLSESHTNLGFAAVPPLIVLCLDELFVRQRKSAVRTGLWLGLLVTSDFFIGSEELLLMAILVVLGGAGLVVFVARRDPDAIRTHLPIAVRGLVVAGAVAFVLLAYPVWYAFAGPAHLSGPVWLASQGIHGTSFRDFFLPDQQVTLPGIDHTLNLWTGGYQGFVVSPQYLGLGLLVVLTAGSWVWRRDRRLQFFGAVTLGAALLSLGDGSSLALPWRLVAHLPVLENVLPQRFAMYVFLGAAVMLAVIVEHVRTSPREGRPPAAMARRAFTRRGAGAAAMLVAAVALVPMWAYEAQTLPFAARRVVVPTWFRQQGPKLPGHQVVLVLPAPFARQSAMAWQAVGGGGMNYSLVGESGPGGMLARAGPARDGQAILEVASSFPVTAHPPRVRQTTVQAVATALRQWGVTMIVIPDQRTARYNRIDSVEVAAALVAAATGRAPVHQADAWVWTGVQRTIALTGITAHSFAECTPATRAPSPSTGSGSSDQVVVTAVSCVLAGAPST